MGYINVLQHGRSITTHVVVCELHFSFPALELCLIGCVSVFHVNHFMWT